MDESNTVVQTFHSEIDPLEQNFKLNFMISFVDA